MFTGAHNLKKLCEGYVSPEDWKPFPQIDDRQAWNKVADDPRLAKSVKAILRYADQVLETEIDPLTGSMYMAFMRNGDRLKYEENHFRRRVQLSHLVLAECFRADGRYFDRIVDYIWAILGEIHWCVPAHNFAGQHEMVMHKGDNPWKKDDPLPVPDDEYLDLFNCETAATLAETCYLLKPLLMTESPSLYYLTHQEIEAKSLSKFEGHKLYGWFHGKNNWTAWCAHNLLLAACYVIEDKNRLISFANKLMQPMQRFFDNIEPSGSCIEGPSYWNVSAGRLAAFIELIESRFGTDLEFANNEKFRNFGEHILHLHVGGNKFVNFADGAFRIDLDHGMLSHYASMIGAQPLATLIWEDMDRVAERKLARPISDRGHNEYNRQVLTHLTRLLFWTPEIEASDASTCEKSVWLEDMQVLIAREHGVAGKGLAMSAIAGSNDLNINHHSHNDIGHFSVYYDGEPIIIDIGQGAYSKSTFSESRYDKWHISSEGHNVLQINHALQRPGTGADARNVQQVSDGQISRLTLDAAPAYFEHSDGVEIMRKITFRHDEAEIIIEDDIKLNEPLTDVSFPIHLSERSIKIDEEGTCWIEAGERYISVQGDNLECQAVETINLDDPRHIEAWGETICRIVWTAQDPQAGHFKLRIHVE